MIKWNKISTETKWIFLLLIFFIIGSISITLWNNYKEDALSKSKITWAVIDDMALTKGGYYINVHFIDNNNQIKYINNIERTDNCLEKGKVGDTVTIRYSLKNTSIAQLIRCYWNPQDAVAN